MAKGRTSDLDVGDEFAPMTYEVTPFWYPRILSFRRTTPRAFHGGGRQRRRWRCRCGTCDKLAILPSHALVIRSTWRDRHYDRSQVELAGQGDRRRYLVTAVYGAHALGNANTIEVVQWRADGRAVSAGDRYGVAVPNWKRDMPQIYNGAAGRQRMHLRPQANDVMRMRLYYMPTVVNSQ